MSPVVVFAQASPYVDLFDPIYRDIEKLVAFDVVDEILFASRPFTRMDVARFLLQAKNNLADANALHGETGRSSQDGLSGNHDSGVIAGILDRWTPTFEWELNVLQDVQQAGGVQSRLAGWAESRWVFADSRARDIRYNGTGEIDADINPLLQDRAGRHLVDGNTLSLEGALSLTISSFLAVSALPRAQFGSVRGSSPDVSELAFQRLSATAVLGNLRLVVGRDQEYWGQGRNAGILISKNIRGLDMVKVENDRLFRLPWVFKHLGPTKISAFIADLGPDQTYPHAKLVGYRISLLPWSTFEIGSGMLVQTGGDGSPDVPALKWVQDLFPFVENILGRTWDVPSNKQAGLDARWRFPSARGLTFYFEGVIEDIDFDKGLTMFWEEAGYLVGVDMPRLAGDGSVGLAAELHHTGVRMYRHHQQTAGFTQNRFIIGNSLGPDANAAHLFLTADVTSDDLLSFEGAFEARRIDTIVLDYPNYVRTEVFPTEKRYRLIGSWQHWSGDRRLSMGLNVGVERVTNFDFQDGIGRTNTLCEVFLRFNP